MGKVIFICNGEVVTDDSVCDECKAYYEHPADYEALEAKLAAATDRERVLVESLTEMVQAFVDYEMEVDIEPHHQHIKMMRKARAALTQKGDG